DPSAAATPAPTPDPTPAPTPDPTPAPTPDPTTAPTPAPTDAPAPTPAPTDAPVATPAPSATVSPVAHPTIASDQGDYTPGSVVTLTGSGWQPGEVVHIFVNDDAGQTWSRNVDVTANAF